MLDQKFDRFQTLRSNSQQHAGATGSNTQEHVTRSANAAGLNVTCNIQQCWELLANIVASDYMELLFLSTRSAFQQIVSSLSYPF